MISGKGNTLNFFSHRFPDWPIPRFTEAPAGVPDKSWRTWFRDPLAQFTEGLSYPLMCRSNSPHEDGLGRSFAGLYRSEKVERPEDLRAVYDEVSLSGDEKLAKYAACRGVDFKPGPIPVLLQEYVPAEALCTITRHPDRGSLLVDLVFRHSFSREDAHDPTNRSTVGIELYDPVHASLADIEELLLMYPNTRNETDRRSFVDNGGANDIREAVAYFSEAESFFPDVACQHECTLGPYAFLQFRGLREKTRSSTTLDDIPVADSAEHVVPVPLAFGNVEGIELTQYSAAPLGHELFFRMFPERKNLFFVAVLEKMRTTKGKFGCYFNDFYSWLPEIEEMGKRLPVALFYSDVVHTVLEYEQENVAGRCVPPLQTHRAFRYLELSPNAGFVGENLSDYDGRRARYVAAGGQGRLELLRG